MSNGIFGPGVGVYRPGNKVYPPNWTYEPRPPTQNDNQGYVIGDLWLDTSGTPEPEPWVLVSLAGNSTSSGSLAHWIRFAGPDVNVNTLTGDDAIAVPPTNGNIDVLATPTAGATVAFNNTAASTLGLIVTDNDNNTLIGLNAGNGTLSGSYNTGVGFAVLDELTSGLLNTAMGAHALGECTTGSVNSAFGYLALSSLTTAVSNTAVGKSAGSSLISGDGNTLVGESSGDALTTGARNVAVGASSMLNSTNALENVSIGYQSLLASTTSDESVIVGALGGQYITTGDNNVGLGWSVYADPIGLAGLTTGTNNVAIGSNAAGSALRTTDSSNILLGSIGVVGDNNTIRIGEQGAGAGQQNANIQAGIYQAVVGGTNEMVIVDNTGKLGSTAGGPFANSFPTDVGTATPAAGVLNILGGDGINTAGAGNTVTVHITDYVAPTAWTPVLRFGGSSVGITYAVQEGTYSRIGDTVWFELRLALTSKGAQVGQATIAGLPVGFATFSAFSVRASELTFTGFLQSLFDSGSGGAPIIEIESLSGTGAALVDLTDTAFGNGSIIDISGTYFAA